MVLKMLNKLFMAGDYDKHYPKKPYKVKRYYVTHHAVVRMNERKITKGELHYNLTRPPVHISKTKFDDCGRPSYERLSDNLVNARINPKNNNIATVSRFHSWLLEKYRMKGNKK